MKINERYALITASVMCVTFNIGLGKRNKCVSKYIGKGHTSK